ncbi:probable mediator of RNA polymerase II transcription subunit 26b [Dendrobium catenatum]|uniref:Putative mediator of RNA polymerase II transcription subunit 26b n=1 Tax=Dendrobium catenatum TaxID=906689 RepID=A0A2I0WKR3_9ASPA|nr:probable mediator of RNA polymerase II transcription subunit 26b [Dendrobium catenatum]PKU76253.1 putative mediator of RNA polymerase II transcription subunit 26b [Dendrobium catenatum]
MADAKGSLDYWRKYFSSAKSDIFDLIEKAILVAATDCPNEFKDKKDMIVEKLYTCQLSLNNGDQESPKEEKNSCSSGNSDETDQILGEVMRIKELLSNTQLYKSESDSDSDSVLYESLRSLQIMQLSVEILKATEIGRTVSALRKHSSTQIRKLVRTLIDGWKMLVDEWVQSTAPITEKTITDSSKQTSEKKPCNHSSAAAVKRKQIEEVSDASKLELAKKKLLAGYQRIENAKKRRMIQIIEPTDLPNVSHEELRSRKKLGKNSSN